jgi:hypothetical protein
VVAEVPVDLSCDNVASVFRNYTPEYRELLMTSTSLAMKYMSSVQRDAQEKFNCRIGLNCDASYVLHVRIIFLSQFPHSNVASVIK